MYTERQPLILGVSILGILLTSFAVALRFLARIRYGTGLWWDDWLILIVLPFCISISGLSLNAINYGYGLHTTELQLENLPQLLKLFYASALLYQTGLGIMKASILLFYYRIFPTRHVIIGCWILGVLDAAWTIATNIGWAAQCTPIESLWEPLIPGKCIDRQWFILGIGIPNVLIDVGIFLLPVHSVWNLQMPITRKAAVLGIFGVALFAVCCSIIRLSFVTIEFGGNDLYAWVVGLMWSTAEIDVAAICSCLPVLKPLFCTTRFKSRETSEDVAVRKYRQDSKEHKMYDTQAFIELESQGLSRDDLLQDPKRSGSKSEHVEGIPMVDSPIDDVKRPEKALRAQPPAAKMEARRNAPLPAVPLDMI